MDEVKPAARLPTVEHREPCESRGSRTVLGAPGGEIPPGDSSSATDIVLQPNVGSWGDCVAKVESCRVTIFSREHETGSNRRFV